MNYQITFIKITTQEYGILLENNFYRFRVKRTNFHCLFRIILNIYIMFIVPYRY